MGRTMSSQARCIHEPNGLWGVMADALRLSVLDRIISLQVFYKRLQGRFDRQDNSIFDATNGFSVGQHEDRSSGPLAEDAWSAQNTDPNDSCRLHYWIEELPWPSQQNSSA